MDRIDITNLVWYSNRKSRKMSVLWCAIYWDVKKYKFEKYFPNFLNNVGRNVTIARILTHRSPIELLGKVKEYVLCVIQIFVMNIIQMFLNIEKS